MNGCVTSLCSMRQEAAHEEAMQALRAEHTAHVSQLRAEHEARARELTADYDRRTEVMSTTCTTCTLLYTHNATGRKL